MDPVGCSDTSTVSHKESDNDDARLSELRSAQYIVTKVSNYSRPHNSFPASDIAESTETTKCIHYSSDHTQDSRCMDRGSSYTTQTVSQIVLFS